MKSYYSELSTQPLIEQLQQLTHLTWDGDLISKADRTRLIESGLAYRPVHGWNLITALGIEYLLNGGHINP